MIVPKIRQMITPKGYYTPNQKVVTFPGTSIRIFISYESIIVIEKDDKVYLGPDWNYSRTTDRYRNIFLDENKVETEEKLNNGTYILLENIDSTDLEDL
jgi:hypothetical protein